MSAKKPTNWDDIIARHSVMLALEPRFMFDAAVAATVDAVADAVDDANDAGGDDAQTESDAGHGGDGDDFDGDAKAGVESFLRSFGLFAADGASITYADGVDPDAPAAEILMNETLSLNAVIAAFVDEDVSNGDYLWVEISLSDSGAGTLELGDYDANIYRDHLDLLSSPGTVIIYGDAETVNELLGLVYFKGETNFSGDGGDIVVKVFDGKTDFGDATAVPVVDASIALTVREINVAPEMTVDFGSASGISVSEDIGSLLTGTGGAPVFTIDDGNKNDILTVEISFGNASLGGQLGYFDNGTWTAYATGDIEGLSVDNGKYTYTGGIGDVNDFLAGMAYRAGQDQFGTDNIVIKYWDAEQGAETAGQSVNAEIKVAPVNDAPVFAVPDGNTDTHLNAEVDEGRSVILNENNFNIHDVDNTNKEQLVITVEAYGGKGYLEFQVSAGVWVRLEVGDKFSYAEVGKGNIRYAHLGGQVRSDSDDGGRFHDADTFDFTVFDGSNGYLLIDPATNATPQMTINLAAVNQAPDINVGGKLTDAEGNPILDENGKEQYAGSTEIYEGEKGLVIPIQIVDPDQHSPVAGANPDGMGVYDVWITLPDNLDGVLYIKDSGGTVVKTFVVADFASQEVNESTVTAYKFTAEEAAKLASGEYVLAFDHNGNDAFENENGSRTGITRDIAFEIIVQDDGGGAAARRTTVQGVTLNVKMNNDMPYLNDEPADGYKGSDDVIGDVTVSSGWTDYVLGRDFALGGLDAMDRDSPDGNIVYTVTALDMDGGRLYYKTSTGAYRAINVGDTFTQADVDNNRIVYRYNGTTGQASLVHSMQVTVTDGSKTAWVEDGNGDVQSGVEAGYGEWNGDDFTLTELTVFFSVHIPASLPGFGYPNPPTFDVTVKESLNDSVIVNENGEAVLDDEILKFVSSIRDGEYTVWREGGNIVATDKYGFVIYYNIDSGLYTYTSGTTGINVTTAAEYADAREGLDFYNSVTGGKATEAGSVTDANGNTIAMDAGQDISITTAGGSTLTIEQYSLLYASGNSIRGEASGVITVDGANNTVIVLDTNGGDFTFEAENGMLLTRDEYDVLRMLKDYEIDNGVITGTYVKRLGGLGELTVTVTIESGAMGIEALVRETANIDDPESYGTADLTAEEFLLLFRDCNDAYTWAGKIHAQDGSGNRVTLDASPTAVDRMTYQVYTGSLTAVTKDEFLAAQNDTWSLDMSVYQSTLDSVDLVYRLDSLPAYGQVMRWVPATEGDEDPETDNGVWVVVELYGDFYQSDIAKGWVKYVHFGDEAFSDSYEVSVSDGRADNTVDGVVISVDVEPANDRPTVGGGTLEVREGWENATQQSQTGDKSFPELGAALDNGILNINDVDGNPVIQAGDDDNEYNGYEGKNSVTFILTDAPEHGYILYYVGSGDAKTDFNPANWVWLDADNFWDDESGFLTMDNDVWATFANAGDVLGISHAGEGNTTVPNTVIVFTMDDLASGKIRYVHDGVDAIRGGVYTDSFGVIACDNKGLDQDALDDLDGVEGEIQTHQISYSDKGTVDVNVTPVNDKPYQENVAGHKPLTDDGNDVAGSEAIVFETPEGGTPVPTTQYESDYPTGGYMSDDVGTVITSEHLKYVDNDDDIGVIQYTIVTPPANGSLYLRDNGVWKEVSANSSFTQADIDARNVKYVHNGSETHSDSFLFTVSDSKSIINGAKNAEDGAGIEFTITVVPTNNAPTLINHKEGLAIQDRDKLIYLDHNDASGGDYVQDLFGKGALGNDYPDDTPVFEIATDRDYDGAGQSGLVEDLMQVTVASNVMAQDASGKWVDNGTDPWGVFQFSNGSANGATWTFTNGDTVEIVSNAAGELVMQGTRAALNTALASLQIKAAANGGHALDLNAAIRVTCKVDDLGNGDGSDGQTGDGSTPWNLTQSTSVVVYVNPVNAQPVLTDPTATDPVVAQEDAWSAVRTGSDPAFAYIEIADADAMSREGTLTLAATNGTLRFANAAGLTFVSGGNGSATIVVKGTLDALNAALETLQFRGSADYNGDAKLTVDYNDNSYQMNDALPGSASAKADQIEIDILVQARNDAPAIDVPEDWVAVNDSGNYTFIGGISVDDPKDFDQALNKDDSNSFETSDILTVTFTPTVINADESAPVEYKGKLALSVDNGSTILGDGYHSVTESGGVYTIGAWSATEPASGDYIYIQNSDIVTNGADPFTITGSAECLNYIFDNFLCYSTGVVGVKFQGEVNLEIVVSDHGNGDNKTPQVEGKTTANVVLFANTTNTAPVIEGDSTAEMNEDGTLVFGSGGVEITLTVTDRDALDSTRYTLEIAIDSSAKGELKIADSLSGLDWSIDASGKLTVDDLTKAQLDALLNGGLSFEPTEDYNGEVKLTITVEDNGESLTHEVSDDPMKSAPFVVAVTVKPVNDAPTIDGPTPTYTLPAITEGDAASTATGTVKDMFAGEYRDAKDVADAEGNPVYPDNHASENSLNDMAGIIVVENSATAAQGVWQYSLDNGSNWTDIPGGLTATSGYFVPANATLRFVPAEDFNGDAPQLKAHAVDSSDNAKQDTTAFSFTSGGEAAGGRVTVAAKGGQTRVSTAHAFITASIAAVNDAPAAKDAAYTTAEDASNAIIIGSLGNTVFDDSKDAQKNAVNNVGGTEADAFDGIIVVGVESHNAAIGAWQYSTDGGVTWKAIPTDIDATEGLYLDTNASIKFVPTGDYNGAAPSLAYRVVENGSGLISGSGDNDVSSPAADGRISQNTGTLTAGVTAVNDAPQISDGAGIAVGDGTVKVDLSVNEDAGAGQTGHLVGDLFNNAGGPAGHDIFDDSRDVRDAAGNALAGPADSFAGIVIAALDVDASQGSWWYSTDGSTWTEITADITADQGLFLAANASLKFVPAADYNGPAPSLSVHLVETGGTFATATPVDLTLANAVGGTTRISLYTVAVTMTVVPVNDAPTINSGKAEATLPSVAEDVDGDACTDPTDGATYANKGATVAELFGGAFNDETDDSSGSNANDLAGVVITQNTVSSSKGVWQYYNADTKAWTDIGEVAMNNGIYLPADTLIRFQPAADWHGTLESADRLGGFLVDDSTAETSNSNYKALPAAYSRPTDLSGGEGVNRGGTTRFSHSAVYVTTSVANTNDAPEIDTSHADVKGNDSDGYYVEGAINEDLSGTVDADGRSVAAIFGNAFGDPTDAAYGSGNSLAGVVVVSVGDGTANGVWKYSTDGGDNWIEIAGVSEANGLFLDTDDLLLFFPAADYNGPAPELTVHLVDDSAGAEATALPVSGNRVDLTGAGVDALGKGGKSATRYSEEAVGYKVTVERRNDAPIVVDANKTVTLDPVYEDVANTTAANPGETVEDLFAASFSDTKEKIAGDDRPDSLAGVVIVGSPATTSTTVGNWQYLDGGTWVDIVGVSESNALYLAAGTFIRFQPVADYNGDVPSLEARLVDNSAAALGTTAQPATSGDTVDLTVAGVGGETRYSVGKVVLTTSVTAVNDAPVVDATGGNNIGELAGVKEGSTGGGGTSIGDLFPNAFTDDADEQYDNPGNLTGSEENSFAGVVVTRNDCPATVGVWQYLDLSGGGAGVWTDIGAVSDTGGLYLDVDTEIRFVPHASFSGDLAEAHRLGGRIVDDALADDVNGTGAIPANYERDVDVTDSGGTTRYSTGMVYARIAVSNMNDAPEINSGHTEVKGDATGGYYVEGSVLEDLAGTGDAGGRTVGEVFENAFSDPKDALQGSAHDLAGVVIVATNTDASKGVWQYSTDGTNWYGIDSLVTGAISMSNGVFLDANTLIRFEPATDYNGPAPELTVHLVDDSEYKAGYTESTPMPLNLAAVDLAVTGVGGNTRYTGDGIGYRVAVGERNDAPTIDTADSSVSPNGSGGWQVTLPAVNEDAGDDDTANPGASVGDLFAGAFADAKDDVGASSADSLAGVVVIGNPSDAALNGIGEWQYWNGTGWQKIAGCGEANGLYLSVDATIRFVPEADYNGTPPPLTVRLVDSAAGAEATALPAGTTARIDISAATGSGGETRYGAQDLDVAVTVTAINDSPTRDGDDTIMPGDDVGDVGGNPSVSDALFNDTPGQYKTVEEFFGWKFADVVDSTNGENRDMKDFAGVVVVAIDMDSDAGSLQYSTDGTNWTSVTVPAGGGGVFIPAGAYLRFNPTSANTDDIPSIEITLRLADNTNTVAAGANVPAAELADGNDTSPYSDSDNAVVVKIGGNTIPKFNNIPGTISVDTYADPIKLAPSGSVVDRELDSASIDSWGGATLTIEIDAVQNGDPGTCVLAIDPDGPFSIDVLGKLVYTGSDGTTVELGTATETGGKLVFEFNADADNALVTQLLKNITYNDTERSADTVADVTKQVTIAYTVDDGNAAHPNGEQGMGGAKSSTLTQTINVFLPADRPSALGESDSFKVEERTESSFGLLDNDSHPYGDALAIVETQDQLNSQCGYGSVTIDAAGNLVYTVDPDLVIGDLEILTETITYTVVDELGHTVTATVTIELIGPDPVLDLPHIDPGGSGGNDSGSGGSEGGDGLRDVDVNKPVVDGVNQAAEESNNHLNNGAGNLGNEVGSGIGNGSGINTGDSAAVGNGNLNDHAGNLQDHDGDGDADDPGAAESPAGETGLPAEGGIPAPADSGDAPPSGIGETDGFDAVDVAYRPVAEAEDGDASSGEYGSGFGDAAGDDLDAGDESDRHEFIGKRDEREIESGATHTLQLPDDIFVHSDPAERLTYHATLADGGPLPDWMEFDPENLSFTMTPPDDVEGSVEVLIHAEDSKGNQATATLSVDVSRGESQTVSAEAALEEEELELFIEEALPTELDGLDEELSPLEEEIEAELETLEAEEEERADADADHADASPGLGRQIASTGSTRIWSETQQLVQTLVNS